MARPYDRAASGTAELTLPRTDVTTRVKPLPHEPRGHDVRTTAIVLSLTFAATALWAASLPGVDSSRIDDLGLVSALPRTFFISLALLTASFSISLAGLPRRQTLAALNVLVLILVVAATAALVEPEPRTVAAWRHVGVIESISRNGAVDPHIDAYFNWPGFFILCAFLTDVTGVKSAIAFADWAPLVFNLLYLGPLLMLFRSGTKDERVVWLAVWFFYATNWVGQDYFAPQAFAFFLYITALAVAVRWFSGPVRARKRSGLWQDSGSRRRLAGIRASLAAAARDPSPTPISDVSPRQRLALIGITLVLIAAVVPSHQLTPFAMLSSLAALAAFNRTSARLLPVITAVLIGTWITFMAAAYLAGHIDVLTGHVGQLEDTVQANVGERIGGSAEHQIAVYGRLILTAVVWGLALLGAIRSVLGRQLHVGLLLLAVAPFMLVPIQPYGGEVLLRVYLFSLPFMAFLAALAFYGGRGSMRSWPRVFAVALTSIGLLAGLVVARYGNERMDYFTSRETNAVQRLYDIAPPGSLLVAASRNIPWKFESYERFDYLVVTETDRWPLANAKGGDMDAVVRSVEDQMRARGRNRAYLILTRSQEAYLDLLGLARRGALDRFERALVSSRRFRRIYRNRDAQIFVVA